jgi:alpha-tubulin suppressor-like RCC1 family protein
VLPRLAAFALLGASMFGCALDRPALALPTDATAATVGRLAITEDYICELADGGAVDCWGQDGFLPSSEGFRDVPAVRSIAASEWQICMLTVDGEVWCREVRSSDPARRVGGLGDAVAIDVGNPKVCAVGRDGHVRCRQSSGFIEHVRGVSEAVDVSIGSCARMVDGSVECWDRTRVARRLLGITDAVDLEMRSGQTWIVERTGHVALRWDRERFFVENLDDAIEVAADDYGGCARRSNGRVSCWQTTGRSWLLDYRIPTLHAVEIPGIEDATSIAVASNRACVRERDGATRCWGDNRLFELGDAAGLPWWDEPNRVDGLPPITEVRTGDQRVCAVSETNEIWCWGELASYVRPEQVGQELGGSGPHRLGDGVVHALLERDFNCVQDSHSQLDCWGDVGTGCVRNKLVATPNPIGLPEGTVAAMLHDGELCAFGPFELRCGHISSAVDGDWSSELLALPASRSIRSLALGALHNCVVLDDETTWCWRWTWEQKWGMPTAIAGLPPLTQVTADSYHTCGLDHLGRAWCWGESAGVEYDPVPTEIASVPPLRTLSAGSYHTCGLTETGEVWCWRSAREPAAQIAGFEGIVQLDARENATCGVDQSGAVWCSGSNQWRQVNPSSPLVTHTPLTVAPERRVRIIQ